MSKILNETLLEELKMIMEEDFSDLMNTFLEESERQYNQAKSAWEGDDFASLRLSIHTLKGSCANVGAETLHKTCTRLEELATAGLRDEVPELLARASEQLADVQNRIKTL